jgi:hypothetical protein
MMERVNAAVARFAELERIMRLVRKAERMREEGKEILEREGEGGQDGKDVPAFVKKSKESEKSEPPAFVAKSKNKAKPKPPRPGPVAQKKILKDAGDDWDVDTATIVDGKLPDHLTQRKYFNIYCTLEVMKHGKLGTLEKEERTVGPARVTFSGGGKGDFVGRAFIADQEYADEYSKEISKVRVVMSPDGKTIEHFKVVKKRYSYGDETDASRVTVMTEFSLSGRDIPLKNLYYADFQGADACGHIDSFSYRSKEQTLHYTVTGYDCAWDSRLKINF